MDFVLSDESLNKYGFWVSTQGIDLTEFLRNPVMFYNHARGYDRLPIGKWENVRKEGDRLLGTAVFDESDEFAMKVKAKVEKGILNATSVGLTVKQWSDESAHIKQGQTRSTVLTSSLREVSIADIPANGNAMRLYDESAMLVLSDTNTANDGIMDNLLPKIKNMKQIALALGLAEDASEETIKKELLKLQAKAAQFNKLIGAVAEAKGFDSALVASLSDKDPESTVKLVLGKEGLALSAKPEEAGKAKEDAPHPTQMLSEAIAKAMKDSGQAPATGSATEVSLGELSKTNPKAVRAMLVNEPDKYIKLFEAEYGYAPTKEELALHVK